MPDWIPFESVECISRESKFRVTGCNGVGWVPADITYITMLI